MPESAISRMKHFEIITHLKSVDTSDMTCRDLIELIKHRFGLDVTMSTVNHWCIDYEIPAKDNKTRLENLEKVVQALCQEDDRPLSFRHPLIKIFLEKDL